MTMTPALTSIFEQVTEYAQGVVEGRSVAGRLVQLACRRHLRDIEHGPDRGLWWNDQAAGRAVEFFDFLPHIKGEWAGQMISLEPWQVFIVGSIFGWMLPDGNRRYRRAYISVARKNGKTTIAAGIGLYLAFYDGEPGAEVYATALTEEQAKTVCWGIASQMVRRSSMLQSSVTPLASRLVREDNASIFGPIAHVADAHEGKNPTAAIIDEYHAHPTSELADVLELGTGARRQPLMLYTTTAGSESTSPCLDLDNDCVSILEQTVDDDSTFAYIARLDSAKEAFDEPSWAKANPCLGVSLKVDNLRAAAAVAKRRPRDLNEYLRKRCNLWTQASTRWLSIDDWDDCAAAPLIEAGDLVFAGLDLSSKIDLTAAVLVRIDGAGVVHVLPRFWRPEDTIEDAEARDHVPYQQWAIDGHLQLMPGTMLDPALIADDLLDWMRDLGIDLGDLAFDAWNASSAAARLEAEGVPIIALAQGYHTYTEPCHHLEALLASGRLRHGGQPVLRWMAGQVTVLQGPNKAVRPYKPANSGIRDDGIVALLMALKRALAHQQDQSTGPAFWDFSDVDVAG